MPSRSAQPTVRAVAGTEGTKIAVRRLTRASDFAVLDAVAVLHFIVVSGSEAARAVSAELETFLIERTETFSQLDESERHASNEQAFELVRRLAQLGCVVCAGTDQADLRFDDDPSKTRTWQMGCIAISNVSDEAPVVSVENR